ncbi:MAG: cobyrinate a,c-diamide synthase [Gammaproteobacteria bacterium]|nr:cobyrinate a,c-diamide synthase [Gammaproteobacteria bacterium]
MSHLYISAAHKSSGKTTVSIGLCAALAARGLSVQPFKKGPDYIDPIWLGRAAGRVAYNLDFNVHSPAEVSALFASRSRDAHIGIIEGNKGLYDGLSLDGSDSNAALARQLGSPVVLVVDTRGITRGIAPLLQGYRVFDRQVDIAGVILNFVGGARHEDKLRRAVEHYTDIPVLGAVQRNAAISIEERHLGLVPGNEAGGADATIAALARLMEQQLDVDALLEVARTAPAPVAGEEPAPPAVVGARGLRLGVLRDAAFGFYYADDLEDLAAGGAELVYIDAIQDRQLPAIDALVLGGGFPETHLEPLEANEGLRRQMGEAIRDGMPAYAECGGLMYLCDAITWGGERRAMVGVLPLEVEMGERPQGRGYAKVRETPRHPWPGGGAGTVIPCHEFHYSMLVKPGAGHAYAYAVDRGHGIDGRHDGIVRHRLLASYVHMRNCAESRWTERFLAYVADFC